MASAAALLKFFATATQARLVAPNPGSGNNRFFKDDVSASFFPHLVRHGVTKRLPYGRLTYDHRTDDRMLSMDYLPQRFSQRRIHIFKPWRCWLFHKKNGGSDGVRTRSLYRDRVTL